MDPRVKADYLILQAADAIKKGKEGRKEIADQLNQPEHYAESLPEDDKDKEMGPIVKAKNLILQCKVKNHLKKHDAAIKKGKECIEIADQDLIKMEAALEVWRAHEILQQEDDAAIYQGKYIDFAQHYASRLPENDQDKEKWIQFENQNLNQQTNHLVASFLLEKAKGLECAKKKNYKAAIQHNVKAVEWIEAENKHLLMETFHELADLHTKLKEYTKATKYSDQIIEVAKTIADKECEFSGYYIKGQVYCASGDYEASLLAFDVALKISKEINNNEWCSTTSFWIERLQALNYSKKNDMDAAIMHAKKAIEMFKEQNKYPLLETLENLIDLHVMRQNFPEALQSSDKIIEVAKDINDKGWESHGHLLKGNIYGFYLGEYQSSLSALNEAFKLSRDNNYIEKANLIYFYLERVKSLDSSKKNDLEAAIIHAKNAVEHFTGENNYPLLDTLENLVDLHLTVNSYSKAKEYSEKVIEVAKGINDKKREAFGYLVKGHIHGILLGQYQSSLSDLNESLRISNENDCIEITSLASFYLEKVQSLDFSKKNDIDAAILHARKAAELFTGENKYPLLDTLKDLAELNLNLKYYSEAIKYSEEVIEVAKGINDKKWELDGYLMQGDIYGHSGAYDSCCLALNEAIRISKKENNYNTDAVRSGLMATKIANKKGIKYFALNSKKCVQYLQHENKSRLLETLHDLIPLYCESNQYSEALQLADNILQATNDDTEHECWKFKGHLKKGVVYLHLGDHAAALSSFEKALRNAKKCKICESELTQVFLLQEVCQFYLNQYYESPKSCENLPPLGHLTNFTEALQELVSQLPNDELDLSSPRVLNDMLESLFEKIDQFDLVSFFKLIYLNPQYLFSSVDIFMTNMDMDSEEVGSVFNKLLQSPNMLLKCSLKLVDSVDPNFANEMRIQNTDGRTNILEKVCSVITSQKDQHRQYASLPKLSLINQLVSNYSLERFEVSEKIQTMSIRTLENTVRTLASEDHKISLTQQYLDNYKVRFKHLIESKCYYDAFWVAERCRAKELKFHREIEEKDINFSDIESYILERNCGILFYIWCFEDLFIYSIYKGKDDQGKDKVVVEMFHQKNYKTHLESLIRGVWCQISGCSMRQQPALSRTADDVDDKHEAYCCSMRAGPPSENVCHNFSDTNSEDDSVQNPYEELYELLIQPVGLEADELVIIPEGSLYLLPFPALQHPKTKHYLSQDKKLRFSPSMTTLLSHQSFPKDYYARSGSLIIGNPNVDQIEGMEPLPGAQKEAEAIADIIGGVMPLIGPRATKPAVLDRLFDVSITHFAVHIKLNPSAIVLSPEGSPQQGDDDSYLLKPEDIMKKTIHARLVVLSGCNSGLGKICAEGVVGIARAFLAAGASAVLVSRWMVKDYSTCEFMTIFYTYFLDWDVRRSASESLYLTTNDMRTKYPHEPMKWSGFYLMGDDVTIDRESLSVLRTKREPPVSRSREPCECDE